MKLSPLASQAVNHTLHCLLGCSIGEILGMAISTALGWSNLANIILAIALAFFFGYLLTIRSLYKNGEKGRKAIKTAVATDTTSIISMETVDNIFILAVPGAINAGLHAGLFWWSLIVSLIVAFIITVPVNYFFIGRGADHSHH
jgi:hypothetical protein